MLQSVTLKQSTVRVQLSLQADKSYSVLYTHASKVTANLDDLNQRGAGIATELLIDAGYDLQLAALDNGGDRVTQPGWMSAEMENALLTAENHGAAYRLLGDDGGGSNIQAWCELAREIIKHHPDLSKADRQTVISAVIIKWILDANS
jgi:hypothetical protein